MGGVPTAVFVACIVILASSFTIPLRLGNVRCNYQSRRNCVVSSTGAIKQDLPNNVPFPLLQSLEKSYALSNVPMNLFKAKEPHKAQIISVRSLSAQNIVGDIREVVVDHGGKIPCLEGQSLGVIPPGINTKNGRPHTLRLYSLASTRYGDDMQGKTATLCVSRSIFPDASGIEIPDKRGVCSNFLCDAKPGDEVLLTGPAGKVLLLPQNSPEVDIIMVATGTGVAPFRGFLRRLFVERNTPAALSFQGLAWLFLGVPSADSLLYQDEWQDILQNHPDRFRLDFALSREQTNAYGGKRYIQDRVELHGEEILTRMNAGAHFYVCGLRAMLPGIIAMFERVCAKNGLNWTETLKEWKDSGQWHVEVY